MNVLVVGGGAREHSLVWKLGQSPRISNIYTVPGNAGTSLIAENCDIQASDHRGLVRLAKEKSVDLVVIGPETPLAAGIIDLFESHSIPAFGPTKEAARIESSKVFAKELMLRHGIPCAASRVFSSLTEAKNYVHSIQPPVVIKADGLAAGKGSIVADSMDRALTALSEIMGQRIFGSAGDRVIVEECLSGWEVSLLAFTDGRTVVPMVPACDYKRVFDGDHGPNTGGMGAYSPPGFFDARMVDITNRTILEPAVRAMAEEGMLFKGVLYAGIMVTEDGPKALEFNARFGDPENQVMIPRLETDLLEIMLAVVSGRLSNIDVKWSDQPCVGVVMASQGYPGRYATGFPIAGLDKVEPDILVFHAGTRVKGDSIVTDGGRVLTVVAQGCNMSEAREKVYRNVPKIWFEGCHYRTDIAEREVC